MALANSLGGLRNKKTGEVLFDGFAAGLSTIDVLPGQYPRPDLGDLVFEFDENFQRGVLVGAFRGISFVFPFSSINFTAQIFD